MQTHKSTKPFQETKAMTLLHKGRCTLIELWYTQVKPCSIYGHFAFFVCMRERERERLGGWGVGQGHSGIRPLIHLKDSMRPFPNHYIRLMLQRMK